MTYRYVLRIRKTKNTEKITVEAWPSRKELATPAEMRRPTFIIGSLKGPKTSLVYYQIKALLNKYGAKKVKTGLVLQFPQQSIEAIVDAYRTGLMLATLSKARTDEEAENVLRYIEKCTPEEIWFWTSKYLGIINNSPLSDKVVKALATLAK
jgi:hypothetical protein